MINVKNKTLITTKHFDKAFEKLPGSIQDTAFDKLELLMKDPKHPSLRVKRVKGTSYVWEMSVNMSYRITFQVEEKEIVLRKIGTHAILKKP